MKFKLTQPIKDIDIIRDNITKLCFEYNSAVINEKGLGVLSAQAELIELEYHVNQHFGYPQYGPVSATRIKKFMAMSKLFNDFILYLSQRGKLSYSQVFNALRTGEYINV